MNIQNSYPFEGPEYNLPKIVFLKRNFRPHLLGPVFLFLGKLQCGDVFRPYMFLSVCVETGHDPTRRRVFTCVCFPIHANPFLTQIWVGYATDNRRIVHVYSLVLPLPA
jgi:hypothetical protein